jgi:3-oxoacyl-[acyl-carrier protein] reductase
MANTLKGKIALVTGASRGIGASVARRLASEHVDVVLNYRSKGPRAEEVARDIRRAGRRVLPAQADLTSEDETRRMVEHVRDYFGRLDILILNASGGLERDKPADYAMVLNRDAQVRMVDLVLPLMDHGGRVVFVTSHMAHFYGEKPVYESYGAVAASKNAGEIALRQQIPRLAQSGVNLVVVSGDLIEGTITPRLMQRSRPGLIEARRTQAGTLPTVDEFASAIVLAATQPHVSTGETIFVGAVDWSIPASAGDAAD